MNVLFLTMFDMESVYSHGIYEDLLREFIKHGHNVHVVAPTERRKKQKTHIIEEQGCTILKVKTLNLQKTNIIEKGIATLSITKRFTRAITKYFGSTKFDLVLYSTPPITLDKVVKRVKERDNAFCYLLLKDIFPQNAVDLGMLKTRGVKGILYKFFRKKEKRLYSISDKIGCMSQANCDYVLRHNAFVHHEKINVVPNCIEPQDLSLTAEERKELRKKYDIPTDKTVFVYGGNLGKPQGISFLIDCLKSQIDDPDVFYLIAGDGTERGLIESFINDCSPKNVRLLNRLPRDDYDRLTAACDVGLLFLDKRFTIPNFPSRLLSYMQAGLPVLACTDAATDVGAVIEQNDFGWSVVGNDVQDFCAVINKIKQDDLARKGQNSTRSLYELYDVKDAYQTIVKEFTNE